LKRQRPNSTPALRRQNKSIFAIIRVSFKEVDIMARFRWNVVLLSCIAATATAQSPQSQSDQTPSAAHPTLIPRSHEEREARYRAFHQIILNVLPVDELNTPATGLSAQDFVLLDNGHPQELASFREVTGQQSVAPPHIVLVLDAVNNSARSIADEIKEIGKHLALNQERLPYPTSVATLTSSGFRSTQPSTDGAALLQESRTLFNDIRPFECKSSSDNAASATPLSGHGDKNMGISIEKIIDGTCLNERFTLSVTALQGLASAQKNVPGRVIVIWIGPGWPRLTGPEFHQDKAETKANFFDHIVQLSTTLREAQVTVDAVSSPDLSRNPELQSVQSKPLAEGPLTEAQATASDMALQAIATQSGGRVLESKSIADQIAKCVADVQTYYALSFDSMPSSKPDEYHSLHVKVSKPGVKVLTNTLYYGEP
jgi:VWFA-related protein